jgi:hypothetical protein
MVNSAIGACPIRRGVCRTGRPPPSSLIVPLSPRPPTHSWIVSDHCVRRLQHYRDAGRGCLDSLSPAVTAARYARGCEGLGGCMVRRKNAPWAPNSVPDMRRQWCNALDALVAHQSSALAAPADPACNPLSPSRWPR